MPLENPPLPFIGTLDYVSPGSFISISVENEGPACVYVFHNRLNTFLSIKVQCVEEDSLARAPFSRGLPPTNAMESTSSQEKRKMGVGITIARWSDCIFYSLSLPSRIFTVETFRCERKKERRRASHHTEIKTYSFGWRTLKYPLVTCQFVFNAIRAGLFCHISCILFFIVNH